MYYLTVRAQRFRRDVVALCLGGPRFGADRLSVSIVLNPPTKAETDLDNFVKAIFDAMQHAQVFDSDGQIDELLVKRGAVMKAGCAVVLVSRCVAAEALELVR